MRWVIGLFVTTLLATAAAAVSVAVWDGRISHHDSAVRMIHYDTNYDLSAQRRMPANPNRSSTR
jgi:hypothetical protein